MWTTIVSNGDTILSQLQVGFAEALATHPVLMVGGIAIASVMIGTHWLAILESELRELSTRQIVREWPVRPIR